MTDHFLNLNCANCGAILKVHDDTDRFACEFCGTAMVVQRHDGTVSLKALADAIRQVQSGTDRTAAELALLRLGSELKQLKAEYADGEGVVSVRRTQKEIIVVTLVAAAVALLIFQVDERPALAIAGAVLLAGIAVLFFVRESRAEHEFKRNLTEIWSKVAGVQQETERNRKVLEG